jgi:MFS family permease
VREAVPVETEVAATAEVQQPSLQRPGLRGRIAGFQTFRSLRYRNFRFFWFGILAGAAGSWMEQVALGWLIWKLTDSTFIVGATLGLRSLPYLIFSPLGGVIADRFDRRKMLLATQAGPIFFAAVMAVLVMNGWVTVWMVMIVALLSGTVSAVHNPVRQSLLPSLIPREDLPNGVALQSMGFQIMASIGPALAGILIALFAVGNVYIVLTVLYAFALFWTFPVRVAPRTHAVTPTSVLGSLRDGLHYIAGEPKVASLLLLAIFPIMFGWSVTSLLPTFADRALDVGAHGYGLLQTSMGIGAVIAVFIIASLSGQWMKGKWIVTAVVLMGVGLVCLSLAPTLGLALAGLGLAGAARMSFMTMMNTTIQMTVPDALRGRVMSVVMLDFGLSTFGGFLAGSLADVTSVRVAAAFLGTVCAMGGIYFWLKVRAIRQMT